jgi:membrane protease subunit HflK
MTSHREEIQLKVQRLMQAMLDSYNAGIEVVGVKMQTVESPSQVRGADADVQKALADRDKKREEAEVYANALLPQARGEAARIVQDAEGYRQQAVVIATGDAQRFNTVYQEYRKAPEVTRRRLYLETMTQVLGPMTKIIVDDAHGVTLQLPPSAKPAPPQAKPAPADRKPSASDGGKK